MLIANSILVLLIGLAVGSFLNVVIFRMEDLKSLLYGRSHCTRCNKTLAWFDLIPLVSFALLRGRCRYCGKEISWQYPLVETGTGLLFLLIFLTVGLSWAMFFYLAVICLLIVISVYDIKTQTVPETLVWIALILSALGGWYFGGFGIARMLWGGLIAGGFLALLVLVSKEKWMGSGDIKIGLILGFLAGFPNAIFALFSAFVLGSIIGIIYILMSSKKIDDTTLKHSLPFAPFLSAGVVIGIVYGKVIVDWYLSLINF